MNIPNGLKQLFPNADPLSDWVLRDDGSGMQIVAWRLAAPQPTPAQIQEASDSYDAAKAQADQDAAQLRQQIRNVAQSTVGVTVDQLTTVQLRALVAVLLWKAGALDKAAKIRPLVEWDV